MIHNQKPYTFIPFPALLFPFATMPLHTKGWGNSIPIISMIKISIYSLRDLSLFHVNTCILFVLQKIFEQNKFKIPKGINGYFYIRKLLHFNGNSIPIQMKGFSYVEISIYSRRNLSVCFSQKCLKIFYKTNKIQVFV